MGQATTDQGGQLLVALFRVVRGLKRLAPGDVVDGPTLGVLHQLATLSPVRLSELAGEVGLDVSTVSRHVRGLEQAGYVERAGDPADRRAALLTVSVAGREALAAGLARRQAALAAVLEPWPEEDRDTLHRLLARLAEDLSRRTPPLPHQPASSPTTENA